MAIEILRDDDPSSPTLTSPRISFSHDLSDDTHRLLPSSSTPSSDFHFFSAPPPDLQSSPADLLFSHGKLLPLPIKTPLPPPPPPSPILRSSSSSSVKQHRFTRSSSLNSSGGGGGGGGGFRLLPLLSRSSSTGSNPKLKHHHHQHRRQSTVAISPSSPSRQKPPPSPPPSYDSCRLGKGGRIKPVMNVGDSGMSGGLFGFGYIFGSRNNKDSKNRKK
ncbi:hypothetical protein QJS10_CPA03g00543 [Acorus calamus]|uniref:Uncharacterized protein n=1 Tax=Acorus calamus TaxID=4465 RepID=A0AAV9F837_ACOCL|nr:hypothetical protein QJS10_CPA03g00543 [Acorus calamus]